MTEIKGVLRVVDSHGYTYFLGTLEPIHIKELTFVPVVAKSPQAGTVLSLNERDTDGYQRAGDPKRMDKIKGFVAQNPSCVIPPVLLSARGQWSFQPSSQKNFGSLIANDFAAIIDGQHRLGGLWRLVNDPACPPELKTRPIPFMMIDDLSIEKERDNFIDINDNQQGVKKSLLKYLERDKTFLGQVVIALMEDEDSPFRGRISVQKKEDWTLLLFGAMEECVALTFDPAFTSATKYRPGADNAPPESRTKCIEFLITYWKLVAKHFPDQWADIEKLPEIGVPKSADRPGTRAFRYRLLEETGIRAVSKLGSAIFRKAWVPASNALAFDQVESLLAKLSANATVSLVLTKPSQDSAVLDHDPALRSTGKAGVTAIYTYLENALLQQ